MNKLDTERFHGKDHLWQIQRTPSTHGQSAIEIDVCQVRLPPMHDHLKTLKSQHPKQIRDIESIARLRRSIECLPLAPFYEPVAVTECKNNERRLVNLDKDYLRAWCRHMAYGPRVRMFALELQIAATLINQQLLPAAVLLRSHLETAALAAYAINELADAAKLGNSSKLSTLIPKTLLGTALIRPAKKDEALHELLTYGEQETITISSALNSLDQFIWQDEANGGTARIYGLLCELAHPNHRGIRGFVASSDVAPGGWEIRYASKEEFSDASVQMVLETLLLSMRSGYAASEMLRIYDFEENSGQLQYVPPPEAEMLRIWVEILQRDLSS